MEATQMDSDILPQAKKKKTKKEKKKKPTQKRTEPTNKYCLSVRARNILFLCAMELHC